MSSGGKLQLAFKGPQDTYITGRPQTTFFKSVYKRYTNFAKECVWAPFDGNPRKAGKSTIIIERQGDLIQEVYVTASVSVTEAQLKSGSSANNLAYAAERLIDSVDLYIGQQQIDKQYQRWWRLYSELNHDEAKKAQYSKMTSPDSEANCQIYLPLIFFFNRNPGLSLPLVSIPNQQVRLVFNWSNENIWDIAPTVDANTIKCWVNYIYLDEEERKVMSERDQSYLIDQVQFAGVENFSGSDPSPKRVPLNFKHPVKELVWCFPYQNDETKQFNYSKDNHNISEVIDNGQTEPHLSGGTVRLLNGISVSETTDGPLSGMYIEINKNKIAAEQNNKYYNQIQPFNHHSGCPGVGVYSYSFALEPESIRPSGTCNFSRIQDAAAYVTLDAGATTNNSQMEIFATNFNVLDIKQGFASLAFSN